MQGTGRAPGCFKEEEKEEKEEKANEGQEEGVRSGGTVIFAFLDSNTVYILLSQLEVSDNSWLKQASERI